MTAAGRGEGAIPAHPEGISRSPQLSQGHPRQCHPWVLQGWLAPCAPQAPARDPGGTLGAVSQRGRLARALPSPALKPEGNHADPPAPLLPSRVLPVPPPWASPPRDQPLPLTPAAGSASADGGRQAGARGRRQRFEQALQGKLNKMAQPRRRGSVVFSQSRNKTDAQTVLCKQFNLPDALIQKRMRRGRRGER